MQADGRKFDKWLELILLARWLGHGRRIEVLFTCLCASYGTVLLFIPHTLFDSQATRYLELVWVGYGWVIALPFLLTALLAGFGVMFNILGIAGSRHLRVAGAITGSMIWAWYLLKFTTMGLPATFGAFCCLWFLINSTAIIGLALANLPRPGAPGTLRTLPLE